MLGWAPGGGAYTTKERIGAQYNTHTPKIVAVAWPRGMENDDGACGCQNSPKRLWDQKAWLISGKGLVAWATRKVTARESPGSLNGLNLRGYCASGPPCVSSENHRDGKTSRVTGIRFLPGARIKMFCP